MIMLKFNKFGKKGWIECQEHNPPSTIALYLNKYIHDHKLMPKNDLYLNLEIYETVRIPLL